MCLPAVVGILGSVVSGIGGLMGVKAQQQQLNAQSEMERRQAGIEQTVGSYKAQRQQDNVARALGAQRAGFAANGLDISSGSPLDVIEESATEGALDVAAIRWNSKLASDNLRFKSENSKAQAKVVGASAPFAFLSPVLSGVAQYSSSFG